MKTTLTRRSFLKRAVIGAGAVSVIEFPSILSARGALERLNCVQVGCGGRSSTHLQQVIEKQKQNLVAVVDPDQKRLGWVKGWLDSKNLPSGRLQTFSDYRPMFDKMGKEIDAVFVTTPNHHHAEVSMIAMQLGKNVYCEKPVCHDIGEARKLREMARYYDKVATQMGAQGHCQSDAKTWGYRSLCEYIWGGVIGNVTETHSWTDRANGGDGPRPPSKPAPAGMNWEAWIGPAPYRDFHDDLHPHEWHGWYDFGNGSIGNMGCHVLDGVFWALKIDHPTSIEMEMVRGGTEERYPLGSRIRWDIPARAGMPAAKVYWYEGLNETTTDKATGGLHAARGAARNFPPLLHELMKKYPDEELDVRDSGTLYVGDKGVIYTETYGGGMHVLPMEKMKEIPTPPQVLSRPKDVFTDFVEACKEGRTNTAVPFEYGTRLTEFAILGNLAQKAGKGRKVEWDGPNMKVTNDPDLNAWVRREYRNGWRV
jgi:predicted dehydrogenase